jgi:hypothetical protein
MSPHSRRPVRIDTPASLGKVQTHDVARRKRALGAPKGAAYGQAAPDVDISERG